MIGIRVDANSEIAMGHLMRCLTIAKELREIGESLLFIVSEEETLKKIELEEFQGICLNNSYKDKDGEIEQFIHIIEEYDIDKILLDSYEVTESYMEEIKRHCKLIYIDDMNSFRYPADLIINYTFKTDIGIYKTKDYMHENFLLGSKYVPIRKEFSRRSKKACDQVNAVFITTGGSDQYNMVCEILNRMQRTPSLKKIKKYIVVGMFYHHMEQLMKFVEESSEICVYQNITDVWNIMGKCDLAISAGGTTLAELFAYEVPTIGFAIAENQIAGIEAYAEEKMLVYAGDVMKSREDVVEQIIFETQNLCENHEVRLEMIDRAKSFIDGKGAIRIAKEIVREEI